MKLAMVFTPAQFVEFLNNPKCPFDAIDKRRLFSFITRHSVCSIDPVTKKSSFPQFVAEWQTQMPNR